MNLGNHALVLVAALAADHLDEDETTVHLHFTEEELQFADKAEVALFRDPNRDGMSVSIRYPVGA